MNMHAPARRLRDLFAPGLPPERQPLALFDLDETLADTAEGLLHECVEWVRRETSQPLENYNQIREATLEYYFRHGNSISYFCREYGWPEKETVRRFNIEACDNFLANIDAHLKPDPETVVKLEALQPHLWGTAILTAAERTYALRVRSHTMLHGVFADHNVFGFGCVGEIRKSNPEPYRHVLAAMNVPPERPVVMWEDVAANLRGAKLARPEHPIHTVFVGDKPIPAEHAQYVDFHFPGDFPKGLHASLDEAVALHR